MRASLFAGIILGMAVAASYDANADQRTDLENQINRNEAVIRSNDLLICQLSAQAAGKGKAIGYTQAQIAAMLKATAPMRANNLTAIDTVTRYVYAGHSVKEAEALCLGM